MSQAKIIELDEHNTCKLCENALAKYSCPKCEIRYCSVACYKSETHLECSEGFYKECVFEGLAAGGHSEESKRKMLEMLQRNALEGEEEDDGGEGSLLDSDDDDDLADLRERLVGVDLDDTDQVWDKMTEDEKQAFVAFLKSEDVASLIPPWEPWWMHTAKKVELVEEAQKYKQKCPKMADIKKFSDLSRKDPAECVKYNLVNVVAAYAFATRYFNGEQSDFAREAVTCICTVSLCLKSGQNYDDYESALKSVEHECTESEWITAGPENFAMLREDVRKILAGPDSSESSFYVLSALSDFLTLLNASLKIKDGHKQKSAFGKTFINDHFPDVQMKSKSQLRSCARKIDYFLSYTKQFYETY